MTTKTTSFLILFPIVFLLMSCSQEPGPKQWIPVLEKTTFTYLADTVGKALTTVDETGNEIRSGNSPQAFESLNKIRHSLLKLQFFDIPMTEFRQIIYDADRLYYLGRKDEAKNNLKKGKKILLGIVDAVDSPAKGSINELVQHVEELEIALAHSPEKVGEILKTLGERVNLVLLKGDLVLAGKTFEREG